ncbi:lipoprotein insertase outer membrane protein LolB [Psychromonas algicola]|uniref:lipoprotein insertase outer membrane protein LolB n=1 Tax=Psychromonas algicola TaxID=2555642 RepID=UPI00141A271E|nr:lipoprotein insertase outer membrane protein LolB [Psychromonas sp. RZ5]
MKNIITLLFVFMLSGCSVFSEPEPELAPEGISLTWETHQQSIATLSKWSISAKLAIFLKDERETANLYWEQNQDNYNIQLTSFIGTRILSIKKNKDGVEIINNDGDTFTGNNAEQLIQEISPGLNLPISALQQWIKGNPINASYTLNEQQRVSTLLGENLDSSAWQIKYQQYQYFSGIALPRKLDLKRDNLRLKIAINQWQIDKQ